MNGSATGGGVDFQARVIAWISTHILVGRALAWPRLEVATLPVAVAAETGTPGDDVLVELADTDIDLDIQVKKGLRRSNEFRETIDRFVEGLSDQERRHFVLVVDKSASGTIRDDLRRDLQRMRGGRFDDLTDIGGEVLERVEAGAKRELIGRLHVIALDLLTDEAALIETAEDRIRQRLVDPSKARAAWGTLVSAGVELMREAGRHTQKTLRELLVSKGIRLEGPDGPLTRRAQVEKLLGEFREEAHGLLDASSQDWDERLETVKNLVDQHKSTAALELLEELADDVDLAKLSSKQRAQLYNLQGVALLRSDRTEEAVEAFGRALDNSKSYAPACVNMAAVALEKGDLELADTKIEQALDERPESPEAWALKARVAEQRGEDISVPESVASSPKYLVGKIRKALDREAWEEVERSLEELNLSEIANELGVYQLLMVAEAINAASMRSPESRREELLNSGLQLCDRAWESLPQEGVRETKSRIAQVRGRLHFSLSNWEDAETDLQAALRLRPTDWRAGYVLALLYLDQEKYEQALEFIDRTGDSGPIAVAGLRTELLVRLERQDEAMERLRELVDEARAKRDQHALLMLAEIAVRAQALELARDVISSISEVGEEAAWNLDLIRARLEATRGNMSGARELYERASDSAPLRTQREIQLELAGILLSQGESDAAVDIYEDADVINSDDRRAKRGYVEALFQNGELSRATVSLQELREREGDKPWLLDAQASIVRRTGDLSTEESLLRRLLGQVPDHWEARLNLAMSLVRQGEEAAAADEIEELARNLPSAPPTVLINGARVARHLDRTDLAVRMALRATREEPSEEVQFGYINLCLQLDPDLDSMTADRVEPGVYVRLEDIRDRNHTQEYVIVDEEEHGLRSGEYEEHDEAVQPLIGLEVGDRIKRRAGSPTEVVYEIAEIESLAAHTCGELMSEFSQRFPESTRLQSFRVGEDPDLTDLAPIIGTLAGGAKRTEQVLDYYRDHGIPIGMVATLLDRGVPEVYAALSALEDTPLIVEFSDQDQYKRAVDASHSPSAVLSRSALMTVQELGLEDRLEEAYRELIIPQSLLDTLEAEIAEIEAALPDGRRILGTKEGRLWAHKENPEDTRFHHKERCRIRDWVAENCTVSDVPVEAYDSETEVHRQALDRVSFECAAISLKEDYPIYSDDLGLRRTEFRKPGGSPRGFSTSAFVDGLLESGEITEEVGREWHRQLIQLNHFFVPVSPNLLYRQLSETGFELNADTLRAFKRLQGGYCDAGTAIDIGVDLIRQVALSPASTRLMAVARLLVENVSKDNPLPETLVVFRQRAHQRMALLPQATAALEEAIATHLQSRGLA